MANKKVRTSHLAPIARFFRRNLFSTYGAAGAHAINLIPNSPRIFNGLLTFSRHSRVPRSGG